MEDRPPLGVIPKVLWYEDRILDLSRAIQEYVADGRFEQPYWWACELTGLLRMRSRRGGRNMSELPKIEPCKQHTKGCQFCRKLWNWIIVKTGTRL